MGDIVADQIHGRSPRSDGWCILRTNGRSTLRLAQSLRDADIEAWTPRAWKKRRLSRIHMGFRDIEQPVVPSFVFVRARHVTDLLRILALPTNPHPAFTIFLHGGRAPVIAEREIAKLREIDEDETKKHVRELAHRERMALLTKRAQRRAERRAQRPEIKIGTEVRPTEGAFSGLIGTVETVRRGAAMVRFGPNFAIEIETWLLVEEYVDAA